MWLIALTSTIALSCHDALHDLERRRFIGSWELVAASFDGEVMNEAVLAPFSSNAGTEIHFNERTYWVDDDDWRLRKIAHLQWSLHPREPNGIYLFWFEGIYEFRENDELRICVKYHGQGVEGLEAKRWRRPTEFTARKGEDQSLFVLKRRNLSGNDAP
jgi:hypothetical protein